MKIQTRHGLPLVLVIGVSLLLLTGCASTEPSSLPQERTPDQLTDEDIDAHSSFRLEDVIRGRFAGVQVEEYPEGFRIYIRGRSSFYGDNQPLYVIDGMPFEAGSSGLVHINPRDVASIRVLKNPGDTAMYGVRGANGVILIETKRGAPREQ